MRLVALSSIFLVGLMMIAVPSAHSCGAETDCAIGERTYRIKMPDSHDGATKVGAVVFMHGWRGSAAGIMRNKSLTKAVSDMGLALVAPKSRGEDWSLPNAPSGKTEDEMVFFDALIADVTANHNVDPARMMATGFSAGGMMVWNLACERSDLFAGFAPIAGTFWLKPPESCPGPVPHIIHTHGTSDKMVPMTGRPIAETRQGNVYEAFEMMREKGGHDGAVRSNAGVLSCERQTNTDGAILELCLHDGGHSMRTEFVTRAWAEFEAVGAFN